MLFEYFFIWFLKKTDLTDKMIFRIMASLNVVLYTLLWLIFYRSFRMPILIIFNTLLISGGALSRISGLYQLLVSNKQ